MATVVDPARVRDLVRARLLDDDPGRLEALSAPQRRLVVQCAVMDILREQRAILPAGSLAQVMNEVSDEVVGLGPIERLLKDPEVSEVMVNGADDVFVDTKVDLYLTSEAIVCARSPGHLGMARARRPGNEIAGAGQY